MNYLFCFRKPSLECFSYSAIVLRDQPYLLFSWRMRYGRWLRIQGMGFRSSDISGSAYLRISKEQQELRVKVSNLWRSFRLILPVIYTEIERQIDIVPVKAFRDLPEEAVHMPELKVTLAVTPTLPKSYKIAGFPARSINLNF